MECNSIKVGSSPAGLIAQLVWPSRWLHQPISLTALHTKNFTGHSAVHYLFDPRSGVLELIKGRKYIAVL